VITKLNNDALIELVAKAIHSDWVAWRKSLGFTYSEVSSYAKKTHPHIREWGELPLEHRESDYHAAKAALNVLNKEGLLRLKGEKNESKNK